MIDPSALLEAVTHRWRTILPFQLRSRFEQFECHHRSMMFDAINNLVHDADEKFDFYPFHTPEEQAVIRVSTRKAGPFGMSRDDRAIAAKDNRRAARTPPESRSKVYLAFKKA